MRRESNVKIDHLRVRKRRCIPGAPNQSCLLCGQLGVTCNLVTSFRSDGGGRGSWTRIEAVDTDAAIAPRSLPEVLINPSSPFQVLLLSSQRGRSEGKTSSSLLPAGQILREVVDIYFQLIHNFPHTLFYKPNFWTDVESGEIPEMILLGMVALSLR